MTSSLKYKAQYIRKTALINNKIKLFRKLYKILVSLYVSGTSQYRKYSAYNKDLEINLVFSYKYQYIGIKVNSNMKERLLIKCDTTIYADEITNLLIENNIVSRQHDEGQDQNPGAYGAITGIAIYVFEKDYEKAVEIIKNCPYGEKAQIIGRVKHGKGVTMITPLGGKRQINVLYGEGLPRIC